MMRALLCQCSFNMRDSIAGYFRSYSDIYPEESFPILEKQLRELDVSITSRKNFTGHVVADGCVIDSRHKKILLIYHATHNQWQNPGGHIDDTDESPAEAAKREVLEETGISPQIVLDENKQPLLLHIDSHQIPMSEKKNEPAHWHHAMTFLFLADSTHVLSMNHDDGVVKI